MKSKNPWGEDHTILFAELSPDKILNCAEKCGRRATGRFLQLNSMENRVYDIEFERDELIPNRSRYEHHLIIKFYRPGRWSKEQILEEHAFLHELKQAEIPVIAPIPLEDCKTLLYDENLNLYFCLFPKFGGRAPDEFMDADLLRIGRLMGRMHAVGKQKKADHRIWLTPQSYGTENLNYLLKQQKIPLECQNEYKSLVEEIIKIISPMFAGIEIQRIHGDCHMSNIILSQDKYHWLDFDDMVMGPAVQDIWLLFPGRDDYTKRQLNEFLEGYCEFAPFDRSSLQLVEALRTLRYVHFSAWIAKRWLDPYFQKSFSHFADHGYWQSQINDLKDQLRILGA